MKYLYFAFIAGTLVVLDQATKAMVLARMRLHESIAVIPGFFSLTHVHNPGVAFGFLARNGSAWLHWFLLGAVLFALVLILYFYHQTPGNKPWLRLALGLIFGGAIGNLIDRVRFGEVVDFLDLYVGQLHWPAFNLADSGVTVGVMIFILHLVLKKMPF